MARSGKRWIPAAAMAVWLLVPVKAALAIDDGQVNYAAANLLAQSDRAFVLTDAEIYLAFQQAIAAASICGGREFGREDHYAMGAVIDAQVRWALGAATRLDLVENAKADMRRRAARDACDTPEVDAAFRLFSERLWPALAERWLGPGDPTGLVGALSQSAPPERARQTSRVLPTDQ